MNPAHVAATRSGWAQNTASDDIVREFLRKKQQEAEMNLKNKVDEIWRKSQADAEALKERETRSARELDEAMQEAMNKVLWGTDTPPRPTSSSHPSPKEPIQKKPSNESSTEPQKKEGQKSISITKDGVYAYLIKDGKRLSDGFDSIIRAPKGTFYIGKSFLGECLLDPQTGKQASEKYDSIQFRERLVIGKSFLGECLLDPQTGKELSQRYIRLENRGNFLIGESMLGEQVIDPVTGRGSDRYERIELRDGKLIGIQMFGKEKVIG
jgi:hypothetical protein